MVTGVGCAQGGKLRMVAKAPARLLRSILAALSILAGGHRPAWHSSASGGTALSGGAVSGGATPPAFLFALSPFLFSPMYFHQVTCNKDIIMISTCC